MKKQESWRRNLIKLLIIGVILVCIALALWASRSYFTNYAEKVAKPIEKALIEAGAVKVCDRGDNGRGVDNIEPWYGAVFEIKKDIESARALVKSSLVAEGFSDSGFNFDSQHKEWTITDTSKNNSYTLLKEGPIKTSATVYEQKHFDAANDKKFCTLSGQGGKEGITTLAIGVNMPAFK